MDNVYKYELNCATDGKVYVISEDGDTAPTKCPVDTAHTINAGTVIVDRLSKGQSKTEQEVGAGGSSNIFEGFQFTATNSVTTTKDHKFVGNFHLHTGTMESQNQNFKDKIVLQIVDVDGVTYPAGTVLKTYVDNYPLVACGVTTFDTNKKTETNLKNYYLRVKYTSVGTTDVDCNVRMRGFDS